jgi:hypothetical protein
MIGVEKIMHATHLAADTATLSAGQRTHINMICADLKEEAEEIIRFGGCDDVMSDDKASIPLAVFG